MSSHFSRYSATMTVTNGGVAVRVIGDSRFGLRLAAMCGIRPAENRKLETTGSNPMDMIDPSFRSVECW